ncbi:MAG: hypothetical protein ABIS50_18455 [Luteolibacter sp.]|uniref:hypothetical protein n=1 Tax=Luteolibacter sp. TaxID=1962973 RepID=UPI003264831D
MKLEVKRIGIRIAAALLACVAVASAHRPFESSAIARLDHEGLELVLTMSAELAGKLIDQPMRSSAGFETFRPQFLKAGAELYEVTTHGKPVPPDRVFFKEKEGEAVFSVIYPVVDSAGLRFRAAYLEKLPLGYAGSIELLGEGETLLGRQPMLKKGDTQNTFSAAPPSPPAGKSVEPSLVRIAPAQAGIAPERHLFSIISVALLVLMFVWQFQRSRYSKNQSPCIHPFDR